MSKIYNEYLRLKEEDSNKLYLFHNGKFYIFVAEDVEIVNQYVVLKPTKFTNKINKCGFPESRLDDYIRVFNNHKLNIKIIELSDIIEQVSTLTSIPRKYINMESKIKNISVNNITPLEAMTIIKELQEMLHE